jgi:hypothetical protein
VPTNPTTQSNASTEMMHSNAKHGAGLEKLLMQDDTDLCMDKKHLWDKSPDSDQPSKSAEFE